MKSLKPKIAMGITVAVIGMTALIVLITFCGMKTYVSIDR